MTVRAQEPKVLQAVIVADPVDVVELQRQLPASPLRDSALVAGIPEQATRDEAPLQLARVRIRAVLDEDVRERCRLAKRVRLASEIGLAKPV